MMDKKKGIEDNFKSEVMESWDNDNEFSELNKLQSLDSIVQISSNENIENQELKSSSVSVFPPIPDLLYQNDFLSTKYELNLQLEIQNNAIFEITKLIKENNNLSQVDNFTQINEASELLTKTSNKITDLVSAVIKFSEHREKTWNEKLEYEKQQRKSWEDVVKGVLQGSNSQFSHLKNMFINKNKGK